MTRLHPAALVVSLLVLAALTTGCSGAEVANLVAPPSSQSASSPTATVVQVALADATTVGGPAAVVSASPGQTVVAVAPAPSPAQTAADVQTAQPAAIEQTSATASGAAPTEPVVALLAETTAPATDPTIAPAAAIAELAAAAATPEPTSTPPPGVVAMVNGQPVMASDYERQFNLQKAALVAQGQDLSKPEGGALLSNIRRQVLENMINFVLIDEAAKAQGITIDQKQVDATAEKSITDGGGRAGFEKWLKDTGQTEADYKNMIRVQLITEAIGNKITGKLPEKAPQVHARHILFNSADQAQPALKDLKAGQDFAAVAKKYTVDQGTKDNGGDLGWLTRNMMPPEIDAVIFSLEPKKISDVITDTFGAYHIFQVVEKDNNRELSKDQLHALTGAAFGRWLAEQRLAAQIDRYIEFKD